MLGWTTCVGLVLALGVVGCSGGISLAGHGDDDVGPSTDDGEDGTCPPEALSHGRCSTEDATCRMAITCQPCAREVWTWFATDCWCSGGSWSCSHPDCFPPYGAGNYSDPDCTVPWGAGGDADADADPDADADADVGDCVPPCRSGFICYYGLCVPTSADADADADGGITCVTGAECASGICIDGYCLPAGADGDADADASTDADAGTCAGGWLDPTTGLCWQDPPEETTRNWDDAMAYCDGLDVAGHDDWHLPSINELRSLVRGCPPTETGGTCTATDTCLDHACWNLPCSGCPYERGPGSAGAYWPAELRAPPELDNWYWSSLPFVDDSRVKWGVGFDLANVSNLGEAYATHVRCVRPGP